MDTELQASTSRPSHRAWLRNPLWIALGAVITWAVLVILSDQLWRHAFGYASGDAWALAIGLAAYLALMITAAFVITVGLVNDGRHA
jgi:hypothetical protein